MKNHTKLVGRNYMCPTLRESLEMAEVTTREDDTNED